MSPGNHAGWPRSSPRRRRGRRCACGTCRLARASTLARAANSWRVPSPTFSKMSRATTIPVESSPISRLTTTTATSMMFIGSRNCCAAMTQTEGGFSAAISFGPYDESRSSPRSRQAADTASDAAAATTASAASAYGGTSAPPTEDAVVPISLTGVSLSSGPPVDRPPKPCASPERTRPQLARADAVRPGVVRVKAVHHVGRPAALGGHATARLGRGAGPGRRGPELEG